MYEAIVTFVGKGEDGDDTRLYRLLFATEADFAFWVGAAHSYHVESVERLYATPEEQPMEVPGT
jgi:hypothetical protein